MITGWSHENSVRNEQIDYVFQQLKITGWPHAFAVTLAAVAIWNYSAGVGIVLWFIAMQASHVLRVVWLDRMWQDYKDKNGDYRLVATLVSMGMFATGCLWSVIPAFYLNDPQSETFIFVSIALAGLVCATLPALAAFLPAYLSFVTPILATLTVRYYQMGLEASALLTVAFLAAVVGISYIINQIITRSITIDFKNRTLLAEVLEAKVEAEDANKAKSRFLAAASHDLRQPLQALGLILESIRVRTGENQELEKLVDRGIESHDTLRSLFNALLELSRLESHKLDVQTIHLQLQSLVSCIVEEFKPSAQAKGLSLEVAGVDQVVVTDPVLFGRVLRNLLSNAIKFTETGKIVVTFIKRDYEVVLSVIDTGVGIPTVEQERVFDEYHQVSNQARNSSEGIGLGLSVVKKMCQLLGHPIQLYSDPGKGTTFSISLPLGDPQKVPIKVEVSDLPLAGRSVMIIDDDPAVLSAVSTLMADWQCESLAAETLENALQQLDERHFQPDILLSDYRLGGGLNGIDAITAIREQLCREVPALLISGDTDPEMVKRIREQKYFLIQKPVKPAHLRKVMHKLLAEG